MWRKLSALMAFLVVLGVVLSGCAESESAAQAGGDGAAQEPERTLEFIYVSHSPNINVFQTMREASEDAAEMLGNVEVRWMGPDTPGDANAQVDILETALGLNPDAIFTTTNNPDAYDNVVNRIAEAGIPVFTYNIDNPNTNRMAYVGQEFIPAGIQFGNIGIDMLEERFPGRDTYKVGIFTGEAGNFALERRIEGTRRAFAEDPRIELVDVFIYSWDQNEAYNVINEVFNRHPDMVGAFGMDAFSEFIGKWVDDNDKNGDIIVGGFDITDTAIEYIERDAMQYLVGQNTYMQGFMPTMLAYMYVMENKLPPQIINTGAPVITIDNLEDAETSS